MQFGIGQPVPRTEDPRLLTGRGRYTDDVSVPGQAFGFVLRSPHAHADLGAIDVSAALEAPGVIGVLTAADLAADGIGDLPVLSLQKNRDGSALFTPPRPVLARGRVRHVGEPVAFVVAETLAQARDAAELIAVDYTPLPVVVETGRAMSPDAPCLWDEAPNNVALDWEIGSEAATAEAFARADGVVELELVNNRIVVAPMEPRAAVGQWEPYDDRFTLHACSQGAHKMQRPLAERILKVPHGSLRVITGDVGGAFGMKNFLFHEYALVLVAARRFRRPVKWTGDRSEAFVSDTQGRDHVTRASMAFDADRKILGMRVDVTANIGAYLSQFAPFVPTSASTAVLSVVYDIPTLHARVRPVYTNTVPVDAYRGAGRPESNYVVERLMTKAAKTFGMTPDAIRRRNFVRRDQFPYKTQVGFVYDCGEFEQHLDKALSKADVAGLEARRAEARARGRLRGLGLTCYLDRCGGGGPDMADLRIDQDGGLILSVGTITNGQGHETTYTQIVADRLGIDPARIRVRQGDSDLVPYGSGNGGSNFVAVGASACNVAVDRAIEKGRRLAAHMLEAAEADIEFERGEFRIAGTDRAIGLAQVAKSSYDVTKLPPGEDPGFQVIGSFKPEGPSFPNGTHICEVEIDPETGTVEVLRYVTVDDFGHVINPLLAEGQIHGGIGQGLGQALAEETVYDPDSGQLLTGSFMDYRLPRAADLPMIETDRIEVPTARNPLGVKGNGECGAIAAPPVLVHALLDALAPLGIEHLDMPATPMKIWRLIRAAQASR